MGEGVRELDEALEGEGDIDPSSDPRIVSSTASGSSTPSPALRVRALGTLLSVPARRGGRPVVGATRCFGASGGLFAAGWNSMMGRRRFSQLYCFASCRPRSSGIHVPREGSMRKKVWSVLESQPFGRTLVFPIAALDFLVFTFLNFTFENPGTLWFVEASDF